MTLDLSVLDDYQRAEHTQHSLSSQIGAVLELLLDDVEEDPEQPRRAFDVQVLRAMATTIASRGVQQPITVRPRTSGKYRIVQGSCRYRASKLAGKTTIPAIVQADAVRFDDYAQVIENVQRADLTPMELARFIGKRRTAGDSNTKIAGELGMAPAAVTAHLSLLTAPPAILDALEAGRIDGARGGYDLCRLHEQETEAVEAFLVKHADRDITRSMIRELGELIRDGANTTSQCGTTQLEPISGLPGQQISPTGDIAGGHIAGVHDSHCSQNSSSDRDAGAIARRDAASGDDPSRGNATGMPFDNPDLERKRRTPKPDDPLRIRKPLMLADHDGRAVMLRLDRKPTSPGLGFVKYEDGSGEQEIALGQLTNWTLTDSKV